MARIKYSGLVTDIRGSVGGTTFQSNAYGATIKNKPAMIIPNTQLQQRSKTLISRISTTWRTLSAAQREEIESWSSAYPQYSKHNPEIALTGFPVFVRYYCVRRLSNPAGAITPISPPSAPPVIDSYTCHGSVIAGTFKITTTWAIGDGTWLNAYWLSPPLGATNNFPFSLMRFQGMSASENDDITTNISYTAKFGRIPQVGEYVYVMYRLVDENSYTVTAPTLIKVLIQAV